MASRAFPKARRDPRTGGLVRPSAPTVRTRTITRGGGGGRQEIKVLYISEPGKGTRRIEVPASEFEAKQAEGYSVSPQQAELVAETVQQKAGETQILQAQRAERTAERLEAQRQEAIRQQRGLSLEEIRGESQALPESAKRLAQIQIFKQAKIRDLPYGIARSRGFEQKLRDIQEESQQQLVDQTLPEGQVPIRFGGRTFDVQFDRPRPRAGGTIEAAQPFSKDEKRITEQYQYFGLPKVKSEIIKQTGRKIVSPFIGLVKAAKYSTTPAFADPNLIYDPQRSFTSNLFQRERRLISDPDVQTAGAIGVLATLPPAIAGTTFGVALGKSYLDVYRKPTVETISEAGALTTFGAVGAGLRNVRLGRVIKESSLLPLRILTGAAPKTFGGKALRVKQIKVKRGTRGRKPKSKSQRRKETLQQYYDPRKFVDVRVGEIGTRVRSPELKRQFTKERVIREKPERTIEKTFEFDKPLSSKELMSKGLFKTKEKKIYRKDIQDFIIKTQKIPIKGVTKRTKLKIKEVIPRETSQIKDILIGTQQIGVAGKGKRVREKGISLFLEKGSPREFIIPKGTMKPIVGRRILKSTFEKSQVGKPSEPGLRKQFPEGFGSQIIRTSKVPQLDVLFKQGLKTTALVKKGGKLDLPPKRQPVKKPETTGRLLYDQTKRILGSEPKQKLKIEKRKPIYKQEPVKPGFRRGTYERLTQRLKPRVEESRIRVSQKLERSIALRRPTDPIKSLLSFSKKASRSPFEDIGKAMTKRKRKLRPEEYFIEPELGYIPTRRLPDSSKLFTLSPSQYMIKTVPKTRSKLVPALFFSTQSSLDSTTKEDQLLKMDISPAQQQIISQDQTQDQIDDTIQDQMQSLSQTVSPPPPPPSTRFPSRSTPRTDIIEPELILPFNLGTPRPRPRVRITPEDPPPRIRTPFDLDIPELKKKKKKKKKKGRRIRTSIQFYTPTLVGLTLPKIPAKKGLADLAFSGLEARPQVKINARKKRRKR